MNLDAGEGWKTGRKVDTLGGQSSSGLLGQREALPQEAKGAQASLSNLRSRTYKAGAGITGLLYFCPVLERSGPTLLTDGGKQKGPTQVLYAQAVGVPLGRLCCEQVFRPGTLSV